VADDVRTPDTHITDDMRRAAFAVARENWDRMRLASVTGVDAEYEKCAVDLVVGKVLDLVAEGVSSALAGCAVVQLPEPDGTYGDGQDIAWDVSDGNPVTAYVGTYGPTVDAPDGTPFTPEAAEEYALALLAAAREARRLAAGSQVGDQHGG